MLYYYNSIYFSYADAHKVQQEIIKLTELEYKQHEENKQKKVKFEIETLEAKHKKEYERLTHNFFIQYAELKKERAIKFDELVQKFKNKHKGLENTQKLEVNNFDKNDKLTYIRAKQADVNFSKFFNIYS